jgi:prepilin-type N-terminal cleavage/methylation domain-containing protein
VKRALRTKRPASVPTRRQRRRDAGLTLIELLVTIIVAAVVASSTFVFFAGQQRIYDTQTKVLTIQQNLWMAMEVMSRNLRAAGTGMLGCQDNVVPMAGSTTPFTGIRAWYSGLGVIRISPLHIKNGAAGAPDEITFNFFPNTSGNWTDGRLEAEVKTTYNGSNLKTADSSPFREGEFIILMDITTNPPGGDRGCTMFQISGIAGASDLIIVNPSSPWNASGHAPGLVPYDYVPENTGIRNLGTLNSVRYFIDSTDAPARAPRLMVDDFADGAPAQVLAEGIEDMQIAFSCDLQPVGAPDGQLTEGTNTATRLTDEWTYNVAGDAVPASCGMPTAIRITLVGRSLTSETNLMGTGATVTTTSSSKPAVEDGVAGAPDQFRHRVLTTTVFPRN